MTAKCETERLALRLRVQAVRMVHAVNASHIGACLTIADILAVLYGRLLRVDPAQPDWPEHRQAGAA